LIDITVAVFEAEPPCCTDRLLDESVTEKSCKGVTVKLYVAVLVNPPPLPVIAMAYVPVGALDGSGMISVLPKVGYPL